jgi:NADPH-dependent FMN reductase
MMAALQTPNAFADFINVLILVCLPVGPINRALRRHAIDHAPEGVMVSVFDNPARLPRYHEAPEDDQGKPDAVVELRLAAAEVDAMLLVTSYRGRLPSMANNAIDWLTRRRRRGALHNKPLAVVGQSAGCYSGVWSPRVEDTRGVLGPRVIEPLTVRSLPDVVTLLAAEVYRGSADVVIPLSRPLVEPNRDPRRADNF